MSKPIVNRVANSALQVVDLEAFYQEGPRKLFAVVDFLTDGVVLHEQAFREKLNQHNWDDYQDCFVAVYCPKDVIIPQWAPLLIVTYLHPKCKAVVVGSLNELEQHLFAEKLFGFDTTAYQDGLVMIKGCSNKPVPEQALGLLARKLTPIVKKLSYGEACSSVPLYKRS